MHTTGALLAVSAVFVGFAKAYKELQINYYSDSGCSSYISQIDVDWASQINDCYNYQLGNSVNIADCFAPNGYCICYFYEGLNCQGNVGIARYGGPNCLANAGKYKSFNCGIN